MKVASEWGLTVSTGKTKEMVIGNNVDDSEVRPVPVEGGSFDILDHFTYLGADISRDGEIHK